MPGGGQTSAAPLLLQTAAWGTLGTLRTFLSFSMDKDVQRLLRAIAGQGRPLPPLPLRIHLLETGLWTKKGPGRRSHALNTGLRNASIPVGHVPRLVCHGSSQDTLAAVSLFLFYG